MPYQYVTSSVFSEADWYLTIDFFFYQSPTTACFFYQSPTTTTFVIINNAN